MNIKFVLAITLAFSFCFAMLVSTASAQGETKKVRFFDRIAQDGNPNNLIEIFEGQRTTPDGTPSTFAPTFMNPFSLRSNISSQTKDIPCHDVDVYLSNMFIFGCSGGVYKLVAPPYGTPTLVRPGFISDTTYSVAEGSGFIYIAGSYINGTTSVGDIDVSKDQGVTWQSIANVPNKIFTSIECATTYNCIALGSSDVASVPQGVYTLANPGRPASWSPMSPTGLTTTNFGFQMAALPGFTATAGNRFCRSYDGGGNWNCVAPANGAEAQSNGVFCLDPMNCYMVGGVNNNVGWIRKTTDGGNTWSARLITTTFPLNAVIFNPNYPLRGWAVGGSIGSSTANGAILGTEDGGVTWQVLNLVGSRMVSCDFKQITNSPQINIVCIGQYYNSSGRVATEIWQNIDQ